MTPRELVAILLFLGGAVALIVAAVAYGGWEAGLAVGGLLMLGGSVLLGLDTTPDELPAAPGDQL